MSDLWLPGAERVHGARRGGTMIGGPARMVHHITWDRLDPRPSFDAVRDYLSGRYDPHLMVDPFTGRIVQFLPANRSAYALSNPSGGVQTNRQGSVCLQVEWYFSPGLVINGKRYDALTDTPMRGWDQVVAWADAWDVPRAWPLGMPNWRSRRDARVWTSRAGHYGHSQVPQNTHTDGGPLPAFPVSTSEEDTVKSLISAYRGAQWVVAPDLTSRVGLRRAEDVPALIDTGQYVAVDLSDDTLAAIPEVLASVAE